MPNGKLIHPGPCAEWASPGGEDLCRGRTMEPSKCYPLPWYGVWLWGHLPVFRAILGHLEAPDQMFRTCFSKSAKIFSATLFFAVLRSAVIIIAGGQRDWQRMLLSGR